MVTDDERREIARKLRAAAVYLPNDIDSDDLEMAIATTVCSYDVPNVETLLDRLADLIDPDLRDESFCKVCGHVIPDGWSECPRCKTKVVSDD